MRYLQRGLTHHDTARATPGFTLYTPLRNATAHIPPNLVVGRCQGTPIAA